MQNVILTNNSKNDSKEIHMHKIFQNLYGYIMENSKTTLLHNLII